METQVPFFILTESEYHIACQCLSLHLTKLETEIYAEIPADKTVIATVQDLISRIKEDSDNKRFSLTYSETILLQFAIYDSAHGIKTLMHTMYKTYQAEPYDNMVVIFDFLKKSAPKLLWRLTRTLKYNEIGIKALEEVFEIETGVVPKLQIDNTKEVATLDIDKSFTNMYHYIFSTIDLLEVLQDDSVFARNVYSHQYMNMADYIAFRDKTIPLLIPNSTLHLTQQDVVMFYRIGSLIQRIYVSDVADALYKNITDTSPEEYQQLRDFHLRYLSHLTQNSREYFKEDEVIGPYMEMVNQWEIPMDDN